MTRKDYPMLAEALRKAEPPDASYHGEDEYTGWKRAVRGVAEALAEDNRAFDKDRFLRDCGVQS